MEKVLLEEIMCDHPIKVTDDTRLGTVSHLLLRYRINGILVVKKGDENKLVGVLTTTDLLKILDGVFSNGKQKVKELKRISNLPVRLFISKNVITLNKNTKVAKAIAIMHKKQVHTLPVYDGDKLVRVVGRHDILNIALA